MTENDQGSTLPTPGGDGGTPEPVTTTKAKPTGSGRFAVYDRRILQYVGGVAESKPTKAEAKRAVGHDDFDIREV
jgi:hypothetical protein